MSRPNPLFANAVTAAKASPAALALELQKPGASPNVREYLDDDDGEWGSFLILHLINALPDDSLVNCLQVLIDDEVDLNVEGFDAETPLHTACISLKIKSIYLLIAKNAKVYPPLLRAVALARPSIPSPELEIEKLNLVKYLVETCHLDINAVDSYGRTILHESLFFWRSEPDIFKYFIEQKFDLTLQAKEKTVLISLVECMISERKNHPHHIIQETNHYKCFCIVVNAIHKTLWKKALEMWHDKTPIILELNKLVEQYCVDPRSNFPEILREYLIDNVVNPMLRGMDVGLALCSGLNPNLVPAKHTFFKNKLFDRNILKEIVSYLPGTPQSTNQPKVTFLMRIAQ
jgi:ankyrin repeat protein